MAIAAKVTYVDITRRRKRVGLELTFSGNYTTGGDTLDLTAVTNPSNFPGGFFGSVPDDYAIKNDADGDGFSITLGALLTNSKVKVFTSGDTELAQGAYPANLAAAKLEIELSGNIGKM